VYEVLMGGGKEDEDRCFSVVSSDKTRQNRQNVKYRKLN